MTGDLNDVLKRLLDYMPPWYARDASNYQALLSAFAQTVEFNYSMLQYVRVQTRIKTATGDNLDLISLSFLGNRLPRRKDEDDESYRNRILAFLLPFPSTRNGIIRAFEALTGRTPIIWEPWDIYNCGFLNYDFYLNLSVLTTESASYDATFFIDIFLPTPKSYDLPALNNDLFLNDSSWLWNNELLGRVVNEDDIVALLKATKAAGVRSLYRILD